MSEFIIIEDQIHICIKKARAVISIVISRVVLVAPLSVGGWTLAAAGGLRNDSVIVRTQALRVSPEEVIEVILGQAGSVDVSKERNDIIRTILVKGRCHALSKRVRIGDEHGMRHVNASWIHVHVLIIISVVLVALVITIKWKEWVRWVNFG